MTTTLTPTPMIDESAHRHAIGRATGEHLRFGGMEILVLASTEERS